MLCTTVAVCSCSHMPSSLLLPCPFMRKLQHIAHKLTNVAICPHERWPGQCLNAAALCNRDTEAQAQAAAAAAEVERSEHAAAQGLSKQLQAEGERRARAFRTAVKAGVAKVQAELEAERDLLAAR